MASNTGWWYTYLSEKYEFVNWDDELPNIVGKVKFMFQITNQNMYIICGAVAWHERRQPLTKKHRALQNQKLKLTKETSRSSSDIEQMQKNK